MERNEDFYVEYFDGNKWVIVGQYIVGNDFNNNAFHHESGIIIEKGSNFNFSNNMQIRFRCDASGNGDKIYIDEVLVFAK